ncbi:uncharacterized protein B0T23DRAFT_92685 [Neurospora hispaniola]|uniref:Questionable protein n=1 Tax=Neurospora hispaniola TaxID=588809 RepID=A0AAJ0IDG8_9PEZI|nr:hypothetical protein B0T23DRAFT_92685 [Neurospora hispaniola]
MFNFLFSFFFFFPPSSGFHEAANKQALALISWDTVHYVGLQGGKGKAESKTLVDLEPNRKTGGFGRSVMMCESTVSPPPPPCNSSVKRDAGRGAGVNCPGEGNSNCGMRARAARQCTSLLKDQRVI